MPSMIDSALSVIGLIGCGALCSAAFALTTLTIGKIVELVSGR